MLQMGMTMRMRLSETVDTSKNEEVRPLELNQVSPVYIKAFKDITEDVLTAIMLLLIKDLELLLFLKCAFFIVFSCVLLAS